MTNISPEFEGAHLQQDGVVTASDLDLASESQPKRFRLNAQRYLIVIYHHLFRDEKIYGYVGGHEQTLARPYPMVSEPLVDLTTECPRCGNVVCAGQLLCVCCHAIFLVAGNSRLYSPILSGVVNILPLQKRRPAVKCDSMVARALS